MPDISLRFHKDMLVLSSPASSAFERLGVDVRRDLEMTMLLEPETLEDVHKLEAMAGAQCMVAATGTLTPARLAHGGMEASAAELARIALAAVRTQKPQHVLVELKPCGLPLDPSSKTSLMENRDQYLRFARLFEGEQFDAFLLSGFGTCADLKCALMGLRKGSDAPVMAVVDVAADGALSASRGRETLEDAVAVMEELGASVVGFATSAGQEEACALATRAARATTLPLLVQLDVLRRDVRQQGPTAENPYYCADSMMSAADALCQEGVQFLRAAGDATPAYTGALVATTIGSDVKLPAAAAPSKVLAGDDLDAFVAQARARVGAVLSGIVETEMGEEAFAEAEVAAEAEAKSEAEADLADAGANIAAADDESANAADAVDAADAAAADVNAAEGE